MVDVNRDRVIGAIIMVVSITAVVLYVYGLFATQYSMLLLKLTGAIAVAGVFGILAWIGYTLATTPPPKPIEEIEKEIEEELKKIEAEQKEIEQKEAAGGEKEKEK